MPDTLNPSKVRDNLLSLKPSGKYKKGKIEKGYMSESLKHMRSLGYLTHHEYDIGPQNKYLDSFMTGLDGNTFFVEYKYIDGDTINISAFEEGQIYLLKEHDRRRFGSAWVAVYSVKNKDHKVLNFTEDIILQMNDRGGVKLWKK